MGGTINSSKKTITGTVCVTSTKKQVHITLCFLKNNIISGTAPTMIEILVRNRLLVLKLM
jgi:hypothetical protein